MKKVDVIGSGFAGLSAASFLAKEGFDVSVFEKNKAPGGRASKFESNGFVFDMGPSWYWMPDVFEKFFNHFGTSASQHYELKRLDPSYRIFFGKDDRVDVPANMDALCELFEEFEPGSSERLRKFLKEGEYKYKLGIHELVYKPGLSYSEFLDRRLVKGLLSMNVFSDMASYVRKFFKDPRILKILEFPVLFLGATAERIPSLYSLMNYADMALGTWYPIGGMYKIIEAMSKIASDNGAKFYYDCPVTQIEMNGTKAKGVIVGNEFFETNYIVAGADYHHVEQKLLPKTHRRYSQDYWNKRMMAPSSLIFFVGLNKKLKNLRHHNLFFDEDFAAHAREIYDHPKWPEAPQFYVSCPSKTDSGVAPSGCENLFILIPVAAGLNDESQVREKYFEMVINRIESLTGECVRGHIVFKRSYAHNDFVKDYNAFKGNAYGLANTLRQTAVLKPKMVNNKVPNLFYAGQLTVPGPGVPPAIISGEVAARELSKRHNEKRH